MSTPRTDERAPPRSMLVYLAGLVVGAALLVSSYCFLLVGLGAAGALPPPAFSNNSCADEKLRFLRDNRADDADLLVLGSSVAWRHFDGAAAEGIALRSRNIAFCLHNVKQTKAVAEWLLPRMPAARTVILIASPLDYRGCAAKPDPQFSVRDASAYVFDDVNPLLYYFRYFDPFTLLKNAASFTRDRADSRQWGTLVMDRFGDAPMDPPGERRYDLGAEVGDGPEAACLSALQSLAIDIRKSGRRLIVVDTPIAPRWKARFDPDGSALRDFSERIDLALAATGAERWNGDAAFAPGAGSFFDAIHLRWPAAQAFTRTLVRDVLVAAPPVVRPADWRSPRYNSPGEFPQPRAGSPDG